MLEQSPVPNTQRKDRTDQSDQLDNTSHPTQQPRSHKSQQEQSEQENHNLKVKETTTHLLIEDYLLKGVYGDWMSISDDDIVSAVAVPGAGGMKIPQILRSFTEHQGATKSP